MYKIYDYECDACGRLAPDTLVEGDVPQIACACGQPMTRIISMPAIHTIETHLRGQRETTGYGGEYFDENLMGQDDTEPVRVKSLAHKKQLLKERGLYEKGEHPGRVKAHKRRKYSIGGVNGS